MALSSFVINKTTNETKPVMSTYIKQLVESMMDGDKEKAGAFLRLHLQESLHLLLSEDHELYMSADQMEKHLNKLHGLANDKDAFLKTLANFSDKLDCTEQDFKQCSANIVSKGKEHADKAIHKLESQVGYTFEPKDLKEDLSNVITRALRGVPDNNAKIPNVYTNKKVNQLKKTLPRLKKSKYGTGNPPAVGLGSGSSGVGGGDAGGGDGGGGV